MSGAAEFLREGVTERRIRFVSKPDVADCKLWEFVHPQPRFAVESSTESLGTAGDSLDVLLITLPSAKPDFAAWLETSGDAHALPAIYVKFRGIELWWRAGRAVLQCDAEQVDALMLGLAEFAHYERELRRNEAEISAAWCEAEEDTALAFDVDSSDLKLGDQLGERMGKAFQRRIRQARIEPHLYAADFRLPAIAQKFGEELREKANVEDRTEIVDGQLEVFEHIYEMSSQRMGEFRAARHGFIIEWLIIAILLTETLIMLAQTLLHTKG